MLDIEVEWLVVLILLEVEEMLVELMDVEVVKLVEVVVPVGNKKKLAIPAAHWLDTFVPKVADWIPPEATIKSSVAIFMTDGAFKVARFTKGGPAVKVFPRVISPAPIRSS